MARSPEEHSEAPETETGGSIEPVAGRHVILGDIAGERLPQEGWVVLAGPKTLSVRTNPPFEMGARLFVEFPVSLPGGLERTTVIRGEVLAARADEDGAILDIHWHLMMDAAVGGAAASMSREEAALLISLTQDELKQAGETGALPLAANLQSLLNTRDTPPARRLRRYAIVGAAGLLVGVLLVFLFAPDARREFRGGDVRGWDGVTARALEDQTAHHEDGLLGGTPPHDEGTSRRAVLSFETGPYVWGPGDWVRLEVPAVLEPRLEETTPPDPGPLFAPIGWVLATMRPLPMVSGNGQRSTQAPAFIVSELLSPAGQASGDSRSTREEPAQADASPASPGSVPDGPPAERARANDVEGAAEESTPAILNAPPYSSETRVDTAPGGAASAELRGDTGHEPEHRAAGLTEEPSALAMNHAPERVTITVSKSEHTLTIEFDGEVAAQFPVGLGHADTTPEGEFTIANKITNPDWFDRGRVVKAGDPENPLGKRWMGLGTDGRATSYGIHPTNEPESIGADMSRGCIRMRPEDAETVFRLCPVGTVVCIKP